MSLIRTCQPKQIKHTSTSFKFSICLNFSMFAPAQYRKAKSKTVMKELESRKELYDKHGQHIAITYNPVGGYKLPFLVKFPRLSSFFRRLPKDSIYSAHSEGLFNGIFYIPRKFDEVQKLEIGDTAAQGDYNVVDRKGRPFDFMDRVKECATYEALKEAYRKVSANVSVTKARTVKLKADEHKTNFRRDQDLKDNGKYEKKSFLSCL